MLYSKTFNGTFPPYFSNKGPHAHFAMGPACYGVDSASTPPLHYETKSFCFTNSIVVSHLQFFHPILPAAWNTFLPAFHLAWLPSRAKCPIVF